MSTIILAVAMAFTSGFIVGCLCILADWKASASRGHFTIGDKLYRTEEVKP